MPFIENSGGVAGGGSGTVTNVTSTTTGIAVANGTTTPALTLATLDVIAADGPPAADWSNNSKKITSLANGAAAQDAAAFGQIPTALPPNGAAGGDLSGTYPSPAVAASAITVAKLAAAVTLDAIATAHATAADVAMNTHKITGLSNGTAATDAAAFGQIPTGWPVRYTTGSYYVAPTSSRGSAADSGAAATLSQLMFVPFGVAQAMPVDRICVSVTTAAATAVVRLGIYNDSDGVPGSLLVDAGTIDASSTGYKEVTVAQSLTASTLYWCAVVLQTATGVSLRACGIGDGSEWIGGPQTADSRTCNYTQASVSGALPTPATPAAGTTQSFLVKLRAS